MTPTLIRSLAAAGLSLALLAAVALTGGPDGVAQEAKGGPAKEPALTGPSLRVLNCRRCHRAPLDDEAKAVTEFVTLTESQVWHDLDLHARAHANITPSEAGGPSGKPNLAWEMQQVLAPHRPKGYQVHQAAECLTCHATDLTARQTPPIALTAKKTEDFDTLSGVSCEACHGRSDKWIGPHFSVEWRQVSPADKTGLGLVDLRDPYVRAKTCASCHIGSKAEGKFVTHEMFAAGHPPLPPFELVTYSRDQPAHYLPPRQNAYLKALAEKDADAAWARFHFRHPDKESPDGRNFAVGTLAAFEASMRLLADDAATVKDGELLDFAHFDCYACHHNLRADSPDTAGRVVNERRRPRPGVAPGRPVMRPWAAETLRGVLAHGAETPEGRAARVGDLAGQMNAELAALAAAFSAQPFGVPAKVKEAADKLATSCAGARTAMHGIVYSPAETAKLYRNMAARVDALEAPESPPLDHDTAQQVAWALFALEHELSQQERTYPDLDAVVRLRLREKDRWKDQLPIGPLVPDRYGRIDAFQRAPFLSAVRGFLKSHPPK